MCGRLLAALKIFWSKIDQYLPQNKNWRRVGVLILFAFCLFELLIFIIPLPKEALFRPSATLVFDRNEKLLRAFTADDDMWRIRTSLNQISPSLQKFLIAYEDRWFYWHQGINPVALLRALRLNLNQGRIVSGGSTLTMQIARMMEPKRRSYFNKVIEIFRALQLEQRYNKRELLEIYFNIAPYGGNIEGAAAASWLYFGKEPSQLSYGEAALLAALPNSPSLLRPDLDSSNARKARDKVLKLVYQKGLITKRDYQEALAEPVPDRRQNLPFIAPHFSLEKKLERPYESRIYSTLNIKLQQLAEDLLKQHLAGLANEGITNGAVVIIDNKTNELMAAVGSVDFFNQETAGQVNGYLAPRSPGSALKPFVYALGFEYGIISPQHYLEDVPISFKGGYSPENFDRKFNGIVSASEALERSLNVPAINLLQLLGTENGLYQLLRQAQLRTIVDRDRYGLSIALGGCEVNLLELTTLYSALACGGYYNYPKSLRNQTNSLSIKLFDEGTAYLVTETLMKVRRPDLPSCWEFTSLPRIAWKTGTSYGHRDAWSIGYSPEFTIGVWIGNFSGEGRAGLIGAEAAAPLLFDLFNRVGGTKKWFERPAAVDERQVCALSGQLPGKHCDTLVTEEYLIDHSPKVECQLHQAYLQDLQTGYRLPLHYHSLRQNVEKVYIKWPPRVATWLEGNGYPVERIPAILPEWQRILPGQPPIIRSPSNDYIYQLREGINPQFQKICLEAAAATDVRQLYWFISGKLVGKSAPGERLFILPTPGEYKVVCQDDQGRSSEVKLVVMEN